MTLVLLLGMKFIFMILVATLPIVNGVAAAAEVAVVVAAAGVVVQTR